MTSRTLIEWCPRYRTGKPAASDFDVERGFVRVLDGDVAEPDRGSECGRRASAGGFADQLVATIDWVVASEHAAFLENEGGNGLKNVRGALTVARATDPNSAKSEFFINVEDNPMLDTTEEKWGYAVFGKVIGGMEVVDAIHELPTRTRGTREFMPEEPLPILLILLP